MASVEELCDRIGLIDRAKKILEGDLAAIKNSYRSHTFELTYAATGKKMKSLLSGQYDVMNEETNDHLGIARVKLSNDEQKKDLLQQVMNQTELFSFREIFPTINDIFIQKVKENENTSSNLK
jgi:ABC-2 type transport system ATP-binding protein